MIIRDELNKPVNINKPMSYIHGPCIVYGSGDQALVKPKVVNCAVRQGEVYHLLRWEVP